MRQRPRALPAHRRLGLAHLVLPVVIGGCSFQASCGGKSIDSKKAERGIAESYKAATGVDVKVTCPTGIKIKQGATFDCAAAVGGVPSKVRVTQNDDEGNVSFEVIEGVVVGAKVEAAIAGKLKELGAATATVSCGEAVRPSVPGTFTCTAQVPDQALTVEVTIKNQTGRIDFTVLEPAAPPPTEPTEPAAEPAAPGEPAEP